MSITKTTNVFLGLTFLNQYGMGACSVFNVMGILNGNIKLMMNRTVTIISTNYLDLEQPNFECTYSSEEGSDKKHSLFNLSNLYFL
jgi:hypothetical protein